MFDWLAKPATKVMKYVWHHECGGTDEQCLGTFQFRDQDTARLSGWPFEQTLHEYVRIPLEHPGRASQSWIESDLFFVTPDTLASLGDPSRGWVHSQLWVKGAQLSIFHTLGGRVSGREETLLLCQLAADPELQLVSWKIESGGYRSFWPLFSGSSSESLSQFLLRSALRKPASGE